MFSFLSCDRCKDSLKIMNSKGRSLIFVIKDVLIKGKPIVRGDYSRENEGVHWLSRKPGFLADGVSLRLAFLSLSFMFRSMGLISKPPLENS